MREKIYLIPGLMTNERLWQRFTPLLKDKFEFVHINIPNTSDYDQINTILDKTLKEKRVNILGFSLGSYIATYFSIMFPHRVKRLFNVAGTPSKTNNIEINRRTEKINSINKNGFTLLGEKKALSLLENKNDKDLVKLVQLMYENLGKEVFINQLGSTLYRKDLFEYIKNIDIPIYYYYSVGDRLLNHDAIKILKDMKLKNINICSREGISHNIPLEDPINFSKQIVSWMNTKV
ncbi:hypothetical protein CRV00_00930 [Malaciobacter molluscorum]|uniref:alpha/beta fold hydrolase n=1 Tax=Malaciobacter molluscorum TaxID=1032072 RepID=UPI00100B052E|nr:alpha/beta fold hydrolase [Malaciobacter molluscorum]RXJ97430.1 hypothetical protein CRV00_00930 [Malaciobacter molluscorum]